MPSFSAALLIAIKPKDKGNFRTAAMLLFYIQQKQAMGRTNCPLSFDTTWTA
jgi:hypothetical protein